MRYGVFKEMKIDIRYEIKSDLTLRAKTAKLFLGLGGVLLLLEFILPILISNHTLEYQILIFQMIQDYIFSPLVIGIGLVAIGLVLRMNSWRKGMLLLGEDTLSIEGDLNFTLPYRAIVRTNRMSGNANSLAPTLKVSLLYEQVQIKFNDEHVLNRVSRELEQKQHAITPLTSITGPQKLKADAGGLGAV